MYPPPLFRFNIGEVVTGFVSPTVAERVGLNIGGTGCPNINMTMSAYEARGLANALFEAADASEKMLPVVAAGVAA